MEDVSSALDQLNNTLFDSADEVFTLVDELYGAGLTWTMDENGQVFQVTDLAASQNS